MCVGPEIMLISAALQAGGDALNSREERKNADRRAKARNAELRRTQEQLHGYAEQSTGRLNDHLTAINPEGGGRAPIEQALADTYMPEATGTADIGPELSPANAPKIVNAQFAQKMSEALDRGKSRAAAAAKVGGFGQQMFGNAMAAGDMGRFINTRNQFASDSLSLLPHMQEFREIEATRPSSGIGNAMKVAGSLLSAGSGMPGMGGGFGGQQAPAGDPWAGMRAVSPAALRAAPFSYNRLY